MRRVRARAYASIANLGYGFDVFGVAVTVSWDEVEVSRQRHGMRIRVEGPGARGVPVRPRRNTAGVALERLLKDHGVTSGVRLRVHKGAARGGGLGSSAASAAAAVVAANRLFDLGCSRAALVPYASHGETVSAGVAHADNVAAAIFGGFVIAEKQDPSRVVRVRPPSRIRFAIAAPRLTITTAASRRVLPRRVSLDDYAQGCARSAAIVAAMAQGHLQALGRAIEGSFVERARARLVPGYADVCAVARRAGAEGVTLSGAGPAVMAIVDDDRADARAVADAMVAAFEGAGVVAEAFVGRTAPAARVVEAV